MRDWRGMRWEVSTSTKRDMPINGIHISSGECSPGNAGTCTGCRWENMASFHTGGTQALMGDGAVRFLSENIDEDTFHDIGDIGGGQVIGEF